MSKNRLFAFLMLGIFSPSLSFADGAHVCPDASSGETAEDCPWAAISRDLSQAARDGKTLQPILQNQAPELVYQLKEDAVRNSWKALWGESLNFDEHANAMIVDPAIIQALAQIFGAPAPQGKVVHAGLEHTYGYLFSNLKTPYGFKRARWVHGDIEKGLGLPAHTFSPLTHDGTLFMNLTYFMGRVAFRDDTDKIRLLESTKKHLSAALQNYDFDSLEIKTLREVAGSFEMRTDLVKFPQTSGSMNADLLIYSVSNPLYGYRLITAFPVQESFVGTLLDEEKLGRDKEITTHYNAYLEGVTGKTVLGSRELITKKPRKKNGKHH